MATIDPITDSREAGGPLLVEDLGRMGYREAYDRQCAARDEVLAWRETSPERGPVGRLLLVEHEPPVITVSRRPDARKHLLADEATLERLGVVVEQTDRGGDITYHGPGQLVAYPILDLNRLGLNLHAWMRFMEDVVVGVCRSFGVGAHRDLCECGATGVWVGDAKICAMGVRVRKWVTMHGLALNVAPDMSHFDLIVPCGLAGRTVTSMQRENAAQAPTVDRVKAALAGEFSDHVTRRLAQRSGCASC